ncbi:MAG TPA: PEGA domain-containing protein [Kofleriaceae bacterium]|nr:PEGA domain-containing protein [Kofleriaceae bacterium]
MARAASYLVVASGARSALVAPAALAALALACSSKPEPPRAEPRPGEPARAEPTGSSVAPPADPGEPPRVDRDPAPPTARPAQARTRPIDIVLRSSPAGATAAVDGVPIGPTPTYWSGEANGHEHEFTFVLPGYAFARYRFVPITSGIVHARLEVLTDDTDAGVPPEMMRAPDAVPSRASAGSSAPSQGAPAPGSAAEPAPAPPLQP